MALKQQVSRFAEHFTVTFDPGAVIQFNEPILKPEDMTWLTGLAPTGKAPWEWEFAFLLRRDECDGERGPRDRIPVKMGVRAGRITFFQLPEAFNVILTPELLQEVFAGADQAPVNRDKLTMGWILPTTLTIPTPGEIRAMFGEPGRISDTDMHSVWTYEYDVERVPEPESKRTGEPDASAMFVFNRNGEWIEQAHLGMGILHIRVRKDPNGRYSLFVRRRGR